MGPKTRARVRRPSRSIRLCVESLEARSLLTSFTPIQIRHAYGFDRLGFEDSTHSLVAGDGQGTTIAIVDPFDDPNVASDLGKFDSTYGIPDPPSFTKINQTGGAVLPAGDRGWAGEIALDVEYAHAMAPGADLLLVEATDDSFSNMFAAVTFAATQPRVVAISMSWGNNEFSGETFFDNKFVTPSGHKGITFVTASGDSGAIPQYPANSPDVVAVGGTSLFLDFHGDYLRESGWAGSGGGISKYENQATYQSGIVTQSTTHRTTPDLAFDADPNTAVLYYDTYGGRGVSSTGGTSVAAPIMSGLAAVVDQGRAYLGGRSSYDGRDFLNALYHLPQSDLNDIVSGNNGSPAGPGYDLVTGRGTPIVDRFVSAMIGAPVYNPLTDTLLVTGGGRASNDTITLSQNAGQLVVQISASTPVAGSGIAASQTFTFDSSQVRSVNLATGDGTTALTIDDSANNADSDVILSTTSLSGLSLGQLNFVTGNINTLTITGGTGNNRYTIVGTPASQNTTLDPGAGNDTIVLQAAASPVTINSVSGSGADTFIVGDSSNRLSGITATVTVNAAATDTLVVNDGGDQGSRSFTITESSIAWGTAALNYTGLGTVTITGGTGGTTFTVRASSATAALNLFGTGAADTLVGSDQGNLFQLTGSDTGTLSGTAYGSSVFFHQLGNLSGGAGSDTFQFADGASVSGALTGCGTATLDYTAFTSSVVVDLPIGSATGVGGLVSGIATVRGGSGTPAASGVYNLLIGTGGNILSGGLGRRNLLVAGGSASTLQGGDGEDLLVAGSTAYDSEAGLSHWLALAAYWAGSDDYATRVAHLVSGTGVPLLDATMVTGNGGNNTVSGTGALALLYSDALDTLTGFDPNSQLILIGP